EGSIDPATPLTWTVFSSGCCLPPQRQTVGGRRHDFRQHLTRAGVAVVLDDCPGVLQGALENPEPILQIRQRPFRHDDRGRPGLRPRAGGPSLVRPLPTAAPTKLSASPGTHRDGKGLAAPSTVRLSGLPRGLPVRPA